MKTAGFIIIKEKGKMSLHMDRRKFIAASGAAATAVLAGCLGGDTGSPEDVVEAMYQYQTEGDTDINDLLHPDSPRDPIGESEAADLEDTYQADVLEISVIDEEPTSEDIRDVLPELSQDEANELANGDVALVEATVEETVEIFGSEEYETVEETWVVAESGGEWLIVGSDGDNEGCFITTATADNAATLNSLRRFRDEWLTNSTVGNWMIGLYYKISPPIAQTLADNPDSRTTRFTKGLVDTCSLLSTRQSKTDSWVKTTSYGVLLTMFYIIGVLGAAGGHIATSLKQ